MSKRMIALLGMIVAMGVASTAGAHNADPSKDCDTWSRAGHGSPGHHDSGPGDVDNVQDVVFAAPSTPLPAYVHRETGHYVARTGTGADFSYVEIVGGGQYTGDNNVVKNGEGGYEQARIAAAGHHVDAHHDFFGPIRETDPALWWNSSTQLCVSVDDTKVDSGRVTVECPPASGQCH